VPRGTTRLDPDTVLKEFIMRRKVLVCSSDQSIASRLEASLGPGWLVDGTPLPTAIGDADCVVVHMEDPNAVAMADNALDVDKVSISIVGSFHERVERMRDGDFDAFQVRCLDTHVLAARLEIGLARSRAIKDRKARLTAN
jgi:hypothetical protein